MSDLRHLLESIRPIAQSSISQRIEHLRTDRWIDYPRAAHALQRLEDLFTTPPRTRMPSLLIHADSGMGKTMLFEKFMRDHKPTYDSQRGLERIAIVSMEMPPHPTERRIYANLLRAIGAPFRSSDRLDAMEFTALSLLRRIQPKIIAVDEVHHLLAGTPREQRIALNLLKFLSNELSCCIVAMGTHDALLSFQSDAQIASRFNPLELPRWKESAELRSFLNSIEKTLPLLERSNLGEREIVVRLIDASAGITGTITTLICDAACYALQHGREKITIADLEASINKSASLPQPA